MNDNAAVFNKMKVSELFDAGHSLAFDFLKDLAWPWDALQNIPQYILSIGSSLSSSEYNILENNIWIHKTATVAPTAFIAPRTIIGPDSEIRHCAYIRGDALIGDKVIVGNSTELKNVILFDCVAVPHYNYVGDSILGYKAHMGAGAITSNVKGDSSLVSVKYGNDVLETSRKKFGAILGDYTEIGCNSVLNPGTIVGKNSNVYPLSMVRGFIPAGSIYKKQGEVVEKV